MLVRESYTYGGRSGRVSTRVTDSTINPTGGPPTDSFTQSFEWNLLGDQASKILDDEWTVSTVDGSLAAHFEHTFTLTPNGAWILTALDGGEAKLAELGVPFGPLA